MSLKYWKAVLQYGYVGHRNEISVARHLAFPKKATINDVINTVKTMPGTKNHCIVSIEPISYQEYVIGKRKEQENFYLQRLFNKSTA